MKLITCTVLAAAFLISSAPLYAQQQESVADAARKAQEANKANPQPAKVFTNDDIANLKGDVSVVGSDESASTEAKPDTTAAAAGQTPPVKKDESYWRGKFADARRKLADDSRELDVLQREYGLKEEQYYSDPNQALREQNDRKDLNDTKAEIDAKTEAVDKDKQAISDLEDDLRKSGGEPGWADEPSTPASDSTSAPASDSASTPASDSTSAPASDATSAPNPAPAQ